MKIMMWGSFTMTWGEWLNYRMLLLYQTLSIYVSSILWKGFEKSVKHIVILFQTFLGRHHCIVQARLQKCFPSSDDLSFLLGLILSCKYFLFISLSNHYNWFKNTQYPPTGFSKKNCFKFFFVKFMAPKHLIKNRNWWYRFEHVENTIALIIEPTRW